MRHSGSFTTLYAAEKHAKHWSATKADCYIVYSKEVTAAANGVPPTITHYYAVEWPMEEPIPKNTKSVFINGGKCSIKI